MFKNFIQIAGVIDNKEAQMLQNCGVEYLGFPLRLPVNKEDLSEEDAGEIVRNFSPKTKSILITYLDKAEEIFELAKKIGSNIIQLHGDISNAELVKLRDMKPEFKIIKSLIIGKYSEEELTSRINMFSERVDAFITDSYNPKTGATGATGIVHNWQISKALVEASTKPVILAGGLTPENVYDAILTVRPAGVDSHTGVEDKNGRKSKQKVTKFVKEALNAFHEAKG